MIIISVDFDGTLALGNKSHITSCEPNYKLIEKLNSLKNTIKVYIKIVTARGSKNNLSLTDKKNKYMPLIEEFCKKYRVPYDEISFAKEYAHLYIDDMTIGQFDDFYGYDSEFTKNKIVFTDKTVVKYCNTSLLEKDWYIIASNIINTPEVLFCNDELIITERILNNETLQPNDIINLLDIFKRNTIKNFNFTTYINNLIIPEHSSEKTKKILQSLPEHNGTFFHGDLSISNILKTNNKLYLIDPNYKYIFGSYITDAGKVFFSYVAYMNDYNSANTIRKKYGDIIMPFAVSEGCRVCKYKPEYISFVNNIAELI